MRRAILALAVSSLLSPAVARAERLPIRAYTTADGLAHNEVNKIVRDSRGFLWFATNDGLSRFDGYSFSNFGVEQGLPHSTVMDLLETRRGEFWVATYGGLVRFLPDGIPAPRVVMAGDKGSMRPMFETIVPSGEDLRGRAILVVFESHDGTIWCGTRKGLFRLERAAGRSELRPVDLGLPNQFAEQKEINDLVEDEHGTLWLAAPSGLYRLWPDGTAARYSAPSFLTSEHFHDLMKDHAGQIWVGSRYEGFFRISADASHRPPVVVEHYATPGNSRRGCIDYSRPPMDGSGWPRTWGLSNSCVTAPISVHGSLLTTAAMA
jgi:ligand-binding sensor domain-containing protein